MIVTNADFMLNSDGLSEKGSIIVDEVNKLRQALDEVNSSRASLDGWVSSNKAEYDNRVERTIPKMEEMIRSIESFGKVAVQTAANMNSVEKRINDDINNIAA